MFDFFEKIAEGIGFKLVDKFRDKVEEWIYEIFKSTKENNDDSKNIASSGDYARVASSGDYAQVASSGDNARVASSGYNAQVANSGDNAQVASSGDYAQVASSGDNARVASSGYNAQVANSGDNAQVANSGDNAQVASSGDYARVASSGDYAQVANSGDNAQVASSGDYAQVANSGDNAQVANSGDNAQVANSGDNAQVANSGDNAQVASSGDYARVASSGDYAKVVISGDKSVGFVCGLKNIIKAKNGTWISIAEFARQENENGFDIVPIYALSAQIGNSEYRDYRNKILKEDTFYILYNKKLHPVYEYDGIYTVELSSKMRDGITIIKSIDLFDIYEKEIGEMYVAVEENLSAHGYTLREAIDDLMLKKMDNIDKISIVEEIKKTGKVTRSQYRALTGACSYGTNKFCEQHKIEDLEEISLEELRKILIDDYGARTFWNLIDNNDEG